MLIELGIGADVAATYEALLLLHSATAAEVAEAAGASQRNASRCLEELCGLGLVTRVAGEERRFVAADPAAPIAALVLERQERLARVSAYADQVSARLRAARERDDVASLVRIVVGAEEISRLFDQMQVLAKDEILLFDRPPYPSSGGSMNELELSRLEAGVTYRVAYEASLLDDPYHVDRLRQYVEAGEHARLGDVPLKMVIADRSLGLLLLRFDDQDREPAGVVVEQSVLLDSLVVLFETVWKQCAPFRTDIDVRTDLPKDEAALLTLLLTGMKDEAVAHHLGISVRTVRRRLRTLMDRLGVQTRFQAGVEAHRRGWVPEPD